MRGGTIILSTEGRFRARVVEHEVGLGPGVIAIKPRSTPEAISSAVLADYLNQDAAQIALVQLATGTTISRLSAQSVSDLRLPSASRLLKLAQVSSTDEAHPVAVALEDVLWSS